MPTTGQSYSIHVTINSFIALTFVGVYVFGVGLVLWYAAFGSNPIANALQKTILVSDQN